MYLDQIYTSRAY